MKAIRAIFWYIAGFIIVPFLDIVTPKGEKKHWRYLDSVYGNPSSDGIAGDAPYQARVKHFRRIRWYLRNPLNAYLRSLGPNGIVASYVVTHTDNTTHAVLTLLDGSEWNMWDIHLIGKIHIWWGYKLLEDWRPEINAKLTKGHHFENMMLLWPFKNKKANL